MAENISPTVERKDGLTLHIDMGGAILLEPIGTGQRFKTIFVGMERERYLLTRLPRVAGIREILTPETEITVRYLHHNGTVYGFKTAVLSTIPAPVPLVFLSFPKVVEVLSLRRHERVDCFLPATVFHEGTDYACMLTNISSGGCRIILDLPPEDIPNLSLNDEIFCQFSMFGSDQDHFVKGEVKNLTRDCTKLILGIQFDEVSEDIQESINAYVRNVTEFLQS